MLGSAIATASDAVLGCAGWCGSQGRRKWNFRWLRREHLSMTTQRLMRKATMRELELYVVLSAAKTAMVWHFPWGPSPRNPWPDDALQVSPLSLMGWRRCASIL
jgi:hypothetical protein